MVKSGPARVRKKLSKAASEILTTVMSSLALALGQKLLLLRDARQIAEAVLEIAARVLDCPDSHFLLVDETQRELYVVARRRQLEGAIGLRLPLDSEQGVTVAAARSGRPVYVPDVRQELRYVSTGFAAVSELAVPVQIEDRVLGVLNVESAHPDAFSQADRQLLTILASQAAIALQNAQLFEETQRKTRKLAALNAVASVINQPLSLCAEPVLPSGDARRLCGLASRDAGAQAVGAMA